MFSKFLDVFGYGSNISLVFDFMDTDLEVIIKDTRIIFTPSHIKAYTLMTLLGLEYLHNNWILHRVRLRFFTLCHNLIERSHLVIVELRAVRRSMRNLESNEASLSSSSKTYQIMIFKKWDLRNALPEKQYSNFGNFFAI